MSDKSPGREGMLPVQELVRFLKGAGWAELSGSKERVFTYPATGAKLSVPNGRGELRNGTGHKIKNYLNDIYALEGRCLVQQGNTLTLVSATEKAMKKSNNGSENNQNTQGAEMKTNPVKSNQGWDLLVGEAVRNLVFEQMEAKAEDLLTHHLGEVQKMTCETTREMLHPTILQVRQQERDQKELARKLAAQSREQAALQSTLKEQGDQVTDLSQQFSSLEERVQAQQTLQPSLISREECKLLLEAATRALQAHFDQQRAQDRKEREQLIQVVGSIEEKMQHSAWSHFKQGIKQLLTRMNFNAFHKK
jgi:hypothetical protein